MYTHAASIIYMHTLEYPLPCNCIPSQPITARAFANVVPPALEFADHLPKAVTDAEIRYFLPVYVTSERYNQS